MTTPKEVATDTDLAVRRIVARYCHLVDDRDLDAVASLFSDDAKLKMGGETFDGRGAIRAWLDSVPEGLSHQVTNTVVSNGSHPDTFHALSDLLVLRKTDNGWQPVMVGRYHDTLVGTGRSLLFSQRIVTVR